MSKKRRKYLRSGTGISRREFVGRSAAAAAFTIVPSSFLVRNAKAAPSQKVHLACIGVGDQGCGDMENLMNVDAVRVISVCDACRVVDYANHGGLGVSNPGAKIAGLDSALRRVKQRYSEDGGDGKGCTGYQDFREMLDQEDDNIDAVMVATPDHVHAAACLAAINKGKHVFCEKPLAHSIYETRLVADAAKKMGVITQMGNHHDSTGATDWLTHGVTRPKQTPPVPDGWDWDLWLGPAAERPYHPAYAPFNWRGWWAFGNGCIGDAACHHLDPAFWALELDAPTSVEGTSSGITEETAARGAVYTFQFPAKGDRQGVKVMWYSGTERPPRPKDLEEGRRGYGDGIHFVGDEGTIICGGWGGSPRIVPEAKMQAYLPKRPGKTIPRVDGHHKGWIDAIIKGEQVHGGFDYSGPMTEAVLLGAVALRTGKKLLWDSENMKATNAPEADRFIKPEFRDGWGL